MRRPRLLDLCCGGGGASRGYDAAGFDVTGVDIEPQPYYPYPIIRADAMTVDLDGYDVIAASPPCQAYSIATPDDRRESHPDILAALRDRLIASGVPWVIENVPGSPMRSPVQVCGETLRLGVRRHRWFESNVGLLGTKCVHDRVGRAVPVYGSYGQLLGLGTETAREAMGIGWLPWPSLTQAVPPVYTLWIGLQMMAAVCDGSDLVDDLDVTNSRRRLCVTGDDLESSSIGRMAQDHLEGDDSDLVDDLDGSSDASTADKIDIVTASRRCPRRGCGRPLIRPVTGRWPLWCSHACRQAGYRERQTR